MRKLILLPLFMIVTACSPAQHKAWLQWFKEEPKAAVEWAQNDCGDLCTLDWDQDGVVEPEPSDEPQFEEWLEEEDPPSLGGICSQWSDDALAAGWSADAWSTMDAIMWRESRCESGAYNSSSGASGLMQIMPMWADDCGGGSLFDPWFNLSCALHIYHVQGWGAWAL